MKTPDGLPRQILEYRAKNNISQREMARRCHLTMQTICDIETGRRKNANQLTIVKIQSVLNVDKTDR